MKTSKLKLSVVLFLFGIGFCNSQAYYPSLNSLFLNEEESFFNEETEFFRLGLRKYFTKVFFGNLQTTNSGHQNNHSAFYSMKIVPRSVYEMDFFDEEIKLKFNVSDDKSKYPSFPLTFNEQYINYDNQKMGRGNMTLFKKGSISLLFLNKLLRSTSKNPSEFLIETMNYEFKNNIFEIELTGQFTEDIQIKKNKIDKDSNQTIKIVVKNNKFLMSVLSKENEIKITEKSFSKNDFKN